MNPRLKGYLIAAIAEAAYGCNPLFCVPLYQEGMGTAAVLFNRYLGGTLILATIMLWKGMPFRLTKRQLLPVLCMGILMLGSSYTLFASYSYMDTGLASSLLFVYPVMVVALNAVCFHEKVTLPIASSIILSLLGIALLSQSGDGGISTIGLLLVMTSALSWALYMIAVNLPMLAGVPSVTLVFHIMLIDVLLYAAMLPFQPGPLLPRSALTWGCTAGLALIPTIVSFFGTALAIRLVGSTPVAILGALEPLTAVLFGITIFGEPLPLRFAGGVLCIILAVIIVVKPAERHSQAAQAQ
ncbi:MAG: DMT family transporter [Victivallales bacterium]|nr:DMT family transporter [Victivallales bacterium]